jgi:hypothetical protein
MIISRHIYVFVECETGESILLQRNLNTFMEPGRSLYYLQGQGTGVCPEMMNSAKFLR